MATIEARMAELLGGNRDTVLCGDWNIAHTENDIKAWKANVKKAGFLPGERQWLTELMATGWVDVVRRLHPPDVAGPPYSWWSWRGKLSTTTPAGASTITWPIRDWPNGRCPLMSSVPSCMRCGGRITRR